MWSSSGGEIDKSVVKNEDGMVLSQRSNETLSELLIQNIAQSFIIKLMALLRDTILNRRLDKQESTPVNIKSYES
ncbi:hypothetical protein G4B88_004958 [Cannabis sativa]|uniref:Uncharacterized protein n=1 Tax=Cannabis sativa TaxID=3483 RepID=A0A7J6FZI7_CANSA|nr:hypothetical protein G4B88_004958 [Cannabis sativa]